jgi:hypothetical protein
MWRRFFFTAIAGLFFALALAGNPGVSGAATAKPSLSGSPIGVWERTLHNDAGPDPVIVMELKTDGTYSVSGVPFVEDHGSFAITSVGVLSFTSNVNPNHNRLLAIKMDGENALTLFTTLPFPYSEVWTRKQGAPNFPSVAVGGADIPEGLPVLMASALAAEAEPWREDALPTSVRVERMKSGRYQIALHFFSPSAAQELQITVTEHSVSKSVHDGSRAASAPLPPIFMDLPRIVEAGAAQGFKGALKKADMRVYEGHGAAWMATFDGARTGATFSAETGERIKGDVTGYIAQYEADWNHAGELWHKALAQYRKEDSDNHICDEAVWGVSGCGYRYAVEGWKRNCSVSGGRWISGGCH